MKHKRNINRFDPFFPVNMSEIKRGKLADGTNGVFETGMISDGNIEFPTMDATFKVDIPSVKKGFVVVLTKNAIGVKNGLGEKLLEDFIFSLSELIELPQYVIIMNEAVYLLNNANVCDLIIKMQKYGVKFLVSLESMEYFNYTNLLKGIKQATSADINNKMIFSEKLINM